MIRAFHTSASGMTAQQMVVDNTANNLANANTTAFKRNQVDFQDLLYLNVRRPGTELVEGRQNPTGLQVGNGVRVAGNTRIFTAGTIDNTNNPFDLAIEGDGFFQLTSPSGDIVYTRDGTFRLSADGQMVNADGLPLATPISIPPNALSVTIGSDGTVTAQLPGNATSSSVGTIQLVRFPNPAGLSAEGRNQYRVTAASGSALTGTAGQQGFGTLRQGSLERSNVDVVQEMVNLIQAQRAYEFNTRAIKVADEMLSDTNQLIR